MTIARHRARVQEILEGLRTVSIAERYVPMTRREIVYGECIGSAITVNPVPAIVESVIHEVLHALHPSWSERTVRAQTTRTFLRLSDQEMRQIYRLYRRRTRRRTSTTP